VELIVHDLKLISSNCEIKQDSDQSKLVEVSLEFNFDYLGNVDKDKASYMFSVNQRGIEESKDHEHFSIKSQFHMVFGTKNKEKLKESETDTIATKLFSKAYPFIRSHHLHIMNLMGLRGELPWDLSQGIQMQKTKVEKKKNKPKAKSKKSK